MYFLSCHDHSLKEKKKKRKANVYLESRDGEEYSYPKAQTPSKSFHNIVACSLFSLFRFNQKKNRVLPLLGRRKMQRLSTKLRSISFHSNRSLSFVGVPHRLIHHSPTPQLTLGFSTPSKWSFFPSSSLRGVSPSMGSAFLPHHVGLSAD